MKVFAGLTGGIACGKSAAADCLQRLGAGIVDADVLSRAVVQTGTQGDAALRKAFPAAYASGTLDRACLRALVFSDPEKRRQLNEITHPLIRAAALAQANEMPQDIVVLVAPLLFEADFDSLTAPNITIACDEDKRIERLTKRDTIPEALARQMVRAQWTDARRAERADLVLYNEDDRETFDRAVRRLYDLLCQIAQGDVKLPLSERQKSLFIVS